MRGEDGNAGARPSRGGARSAAHAVALAVALAGCGGRRSDRPAALRIEELPDTAALSRGQPLLAGVEPYRMVNGALRVKGRIGFPDGARVQVSIYRSDTNEMMARLQVVVDRGGFDSPPVLGPRGPLPRGAYRFEFLSLFNDAWQPPDVLAATDNGRSLRGPGVTRDRIGDAAFFLREERRL